MKPILSVVNDKRNAALIAKVARLHILQTDVVMDVTWGEGKWWRDFKPDHFITHDRDTLDGVDFRRLPEQDDSVDVVAYDPPYVSIGSRDKSTLKAGPGHSSMIDAYGMRLAPRTPDEVDELIVDGLFEIHRVLRCKRRKTKTSPRVPAGRCLLKCMDYISGGNFHLTSRRVLNACDRIGFDVWDMFLHNSGPGPQPRHNLDGSVRRQVHAHRAHSTLYVLRKR